MSIDELKYDEAGLIPAIAQDRLTGEVRMVAWMNRQALERTIESGLATFYSRSRQQLWQKGETSGNTLHVDQIVADCDGDVLLVLVDPTGPSCHTGSANCFLHRVDSIGALSKAEPASPYLLELENVIARRRDSSADKSYTLSLLEAGAPKIGDKLREEAAELAEALESESDDRVANEAADLMYHLLVGLRLRGVALRQVIEVLAQRAGVSGHAEKAARRRRSRGT